MNTTLQALPAWKALSQDEKATYICNVYSQSDNVHWQKVQRCKEKSDAKPGRCTGRPRVLLYRMAMRMIGRAEQILIMPLCANTADTDAT
jgi:hypothetical protein